MQFSDCAKITLSLSLSFSIFVRFILTFLPIRFTNDLLYRSRTTKSMFQKKCSMRVFVWPCLLVYVSSNEDDDEEKLTFSGMKETTTYYNGDYDEINYCQ